MTKGKLQFIENDVVFGDSGTAITIGSLPANSIITGIKVLVSALFNGGGTDLMTIGVAGTVAKFANAVDLAATGPAAVTQLNTGVVQSKTNSTPIIATYTDQNADATAGACKVVIEFAQL
jgi:hypothetical protein